jgi:hypothetical protein
LSIVAPIFVRQKTPLNALSEKTQRLQVIIGNRAKAHKLQPWYQPEVYPIYHSGLKTFSRHIKILSIVPESSEKEISDEAFPY